MPNENAPISLDEDRWLKMKPKAVAWIIGIVAVVVGSWATIKFDMVTLRRDVTDHSTTLEHISTQLQAIENDARSARDAASNLDRKVGEAALKSQFNQELLTQKLDQIMAEKRGRTTP